MNLQLRPADGRSFWDLSGVSLKAMERGKPIHSDDPWIEWNRRTWLCKNKVESICEVVGYQIAEALDLPVQPWVAFFQNEKADSIGPRKVIGIFVERWAKFHWQASLSAPAETHPDLVGRALALGVLDRHEWPEWLMSEDKSELRLFDLEFIGPSLIWPPPKTPIRDYRTSTVHAFNDARDEAVKAGVLVGFLDGLKRLVAIDFAEVIDFSGHAQAGSMKRVIVRGLELRRREVIKLLGS